jgi:hypothetical protein
LAVVLPLVLMVALPPWRLPWATSAVLVVVVVLLLLLLVLLVRLLVLLVLLLVLLVRLLVLLVRLLLLLLPVVVLASTSTSPTVDTSGTTPRRRKTARRAAPASPCP